MPRCCCSAYVCHAATPRGCCREVHVTLLIYLGFLLGVLGAMAGIGHMPRPMWIKLRRGILFITRGAVDISVERPSGLEQSSFEKRRIVGGSTDAGGGIAQLAEDFHQSWLDRNSLNKGHRHD